MHIAIISEYGIEIVKRVLLKKLSTKLNNMCK